MVLWKFTLATVLVTFLSALGTPAWGQAPDCSLVSVRCVGSGQEYLTIQAASDAAVAGDTVFVFDGSYAGFQIAHSGTSIAPITFKANSANVILSEITPIVGNAGPGGDGIYINDVNYVIIDGFKIQNVTYRCISGRNATATDPMIGLIIRNNICSNSGWYGFYLANISSSLIQGNNISNTGISGLDPKGPGIYLANGGADNNTFRANVIHDITQTSGAGMHFNGDISNGGDGIISGLLVEDNVIYNVGQNGLNMDGVQDSTIQNNIIYRPAKNALRAYQIDANAGPQNLKIINNTFVVPSTSVNWAINLTQDLGGDVIFNNILIQEGSNGGSISIDNSNFSSNNNAVVDRFSLDGSNTTISLTSWRASGANRDQNSFLSTDSALFVNPSSTPPDYHLKTGSPAINAGLSSFSGAAAPSTDVTGVARPQGAAFDIGPYEVPAAAKKRRGQLISD